MHETFPKHQQSQQSGEPRHRSARHPRMRDGEKLNSILCLPPRGLTCAVYTCLFVGRFEIVQIAQIAHARRIAIPWDRLTVAFCRPSRCLGLA